MLASIGLWIGLNLPWGKVAQLRDDDHCRAHLPTNQGTLCIPRHEWVRTLDAAHGNSIWGRIDRFRERVSVDLKPFDRWGITRHLLLNESTPGDEPEILRDLGFVHLLSATGIHLYALIAWMDRTLGFIFASSRIAPGVAFALRRGIIFLSWIYLWLMAGARPGLFRPWALIGLRRLARMGGFRWRFWAPLALSLGMDVTIATLYTFAGNPHAWAPGRFIYSLAVAGGMMYVAPRGKSSHLGLAIGSWALAAIYEGWDSHRIAVLTPLLSWASLPIFCFLVFPALLLASILMAANIPWGDLLLTWIAQTIQSTTAQATTIVLSHSFPVWVIPNWALAVGAAIAGLLCVISIRPIPLCDAVVRLGMISLGLATVFQLIPGFFHLLNATNESPEKARAIEQIDVGQGDAALITGESSHGLIDAGSAYTRRMGHWWKLFAQRGIASLDWLALTHLDEDHCGGLTRLTKLISIHCISVPDSELATERGSKLEASLNRIGIRVSPWSSDCIPHPHAEIVTAQASNARMGAIFVPLDPQGWYVSTGDATAEGERRLIPWLVNQIRSYPRGEPRILKLSHHGSRTSSDPEFLRILSPSRIWISAGARNRYRHPSPEVIARIQLLHLPIERTDQDGTLSSQTKPKPSSDR